MGTKVLYIRICSHVLFRDPVLHWMALILSSTFMKVNLDFLPDASARPRPRQRQRQRQRDLLSDRKPTSPQRIQEMCTTFDIIMTKI